MGEAKVSTGVHIMYGKLDLWKEEEGEALDKRERERERERERTRQARKQTNRRMNERMNRGNKTRRKKVSKLKINQIKIDTR